MSTIQFGVVIPQGWSYDFHLSDMMPQEEKDEVNAINEFRYSKGIAEAIDKYSSIDSVYIYDHFLPYYAPDNERNFLECFTLLSSIAQQ